MAGWWAQLPVDWWPAIAGSLPKPWLWESAAFDLRYWQQTTGLPSQRFLCERWGWKRWRVRELLERRDIWEQKPRRSGGGPVLATLPTSRSNDPPGNS